MKYRGFLALLATMALPLLAACPGPEYPRCNNTEDCNKDGHSGVCVNGMCQECAADGDCKPGFKCQASSCVPAVECNASSDCSAGRVCKNGKCESCTQDAECGPGAVCTGGACQPKPECATDADCGEGRACVEGSCQIVNTSCDIPPVRFEFDSYTLTEGSKSALQQMADCLKGKQAKARVTIEGHADERGSEEYNQALGDRRASAVKKFLANLGVEGSRLNTVSYGEERPLDAGHDEGSWARNRRAEFVLAR
jgi:peptidoglycan-associated lipoprotein